MSVHVTVIVTTGDDHTVRYEADMDDIDIMESHMTGELSLRPGPKRHRWDQKMPPSRSPWQLYVSDAV